MEVETERTANCINQHNALAVRELINAINKR